VPLAWAQPSWVYVLVHPQFRAHCWGL
jgi:hypothetical protein